MPMQAANALQKHIHRAVVGNEQIGVDVQALLQGLRADQQQRPRGCSDQAAQ
jgi:hypothetical protein